MHPEQLGLRLTGGPGTGRRAAVLGRPVGHSRSPALHRAAYAALGLAGWRYDAIDCGVAELPELLAGCGPQWVGFSCTMPLKRAALEVAAEVRPGAALVGAGNTLLRRADGSWATDNTDVAGIRDALREAGVRPRQVSVLGAGGTAQAAIVALRELDVAAVTVHVRATSRTDDVYATAARAGVAVQLAALDPAAPELDAADLVVSTVPAGVADAVAARPWRGTQAVLDAVYAPWPTVLARAAADAGASVVGGLAMLLHQAAAQVTLMTGRPAPLDAMRAAL